MTKMKKTIAKVKSKDLEKTSAKEKKKKKRHALGKAGDNLDLRKAMRSRISDTLTPPPLPPAGGSSVPGDENATLSEPLVEIPSRFDPKVVAEKVWVILLHSEENASFEVRFYLKGNREFALRGDKEGFGTIQALEPFSEVHEKLIEVHHKEMTKVEIFSDERGLTFSSYNDFLEWLELE